MKQTVSLNPGESKTISFEFTPTEARAYWVDVDGLGAGFTAKAKPAPPEIVFSMLLVTPSKVYVGQTVEISVMATNIGEATAEYDLYLGPDTGLSTHITLAPGESKTYTWEFTPTVTGHYSVWADSLHNMFEVVEEDEIETPPIYGTVLYTVSAWTV